MSVHNTPATIHTNWSWMRNEPKISFFVREKRRLSDFPQKMECGAISITNNNKMNVNEILHMEGGQGEFSYTNNSLVQRRIITKTKGILEESVKQVCDTMTKFPELLNIADLGCSSGPNALEAIWEIINSTTNLYQTNNLSLPGFTIFLNDLMGNDFNTLFKSLPNFYKRIKEANFGTCFVSGTPGSFHGRLFPNNSLHLVHASSSVHFLSKVPEILAREGEAGLNKGVICLTKESPPKVYQAFYQQFSNDFTAFLNSRSKEIVHGGQMILTFRGSTQSNKPDYIWDFELLGLALQNLVLEGKIDENNLDCYNVPFYTPSIEEVKDLIEKEESFNVNKIKTFTIDWGLKDTNLMLTLQERAKHVSDGYRAATGPILASHFGETLMDDLFNHFEALVLQYLQVHKLEILNFVISLSRK